MKKTRSHFWYNKRQRNGIFFLLLIIVILQTTIYLTKIASRNTVSIQDEQMAILERQYDSLQALKAKEKVVTLFPFNPNYITDYKGYQLGMSLEEIDRLLAYRKKGRFVNSKNEFQEVTKVSDSLLVKISPYFKFPDWVVAKQRKRRQNLKRKKIDVQRKEIDNSKEHSISSYDINEATATDFQSIKGIGETLSERIVNYRTALQGFYYEDQLYEVWHLDPKIAKQVLTVFKVAEKPKIKKININTASFKQVLAIPYIDYALCKKIFEYRDEVAELQNIEELKNIEGFPLEKYNRIVLYLLAQ